MKSSFLRTIGSVSALAAAIVFLAGNVSATTLQEAKNGEVLKIGFSNEAPYAFQNDQGEMDGFVNEVGLAILKKMGITNVEPVLTEWGSLIPGLKAGRFDIITAGMYILPKRCQQVAFSEPMGEFAESFLVRKGNPDNLHSFEDVRDNPNAVLVTGQGYSTVDYAKKMGIPDDRIMQVADPAAMLQAVKGGRAAAASATVFAIADLAAKGGGDVEVAEPFNPPDFTKGWSAYAFRPSDKDFLNEWNKVQADFLDSDEFWAIVSKYGYKKSQLPSKGSTTAKLCSM
jgi:polar amino acid transport system substrate-binding protein